MDSTFASTESSVEAESPLSSWISTRVRRFDGTAFVRISAGRRARVSSISARDEGRMPPRALFRKSTIPFVAPTFFCCRISLSSRSMYPRTPGSRGSPASMIRMMESDWKSSTYWL